MKRTVSLMVVLGVALSMTACQRFSSSRNYATPLPATPTTPVGEGELQPLDPMAPAADAPGVAAEAAGQQVAAAAPASARDVSRSDMAGGWKLGSGTDNCMAFMALTAWSGGYRANTRGCSSPELSSISAWDIAGKQVLLKNSAGATVATLYQVAQGQFTGQTASGVPVALSR